MLRLHAIQQFSPESAPLVYEEIILDIAEARPLDLTPRSDTIVFIRFFLVFSLRLSAPPDKCSSVAPWSLLHADMALEKSNHRLRVLLVHPVSGQWPSETASVGPLQPIGSPSHNASQQPIGWPEPSLQPMASPLACMRFDDYRQNPRPFSTKRPLLALQRPVLLI